jgi:hypothetical protein
MSALDIITDIFLILLISGLIVIYVLLHQVSKKLKDALKILQDAEHLWGGHQ